MENPTCWSELPFDFLTPIFQRMSFLDFQRAKLVCSNWYSASKHRVIKKKGCPWLMLFPENSNCVLYNPEVNEFYKPFIDYSGFRFLANSGKWFLVLTPQYNLSIIDLFTSERIDLPPLESLVLRDNPRLQRIEDKKFKFVPTDNDNEYERCRNYYVDMVRGLLWVDEKNRANYVVVWYFSSSDASKPCNIAFCNNGYDKYLEIPIKERDIKSFRYPNPNYMLLRGYKLYGHTYTHPVGYVRILDLSGESFQDVTQNKTSRLANLTNVTNFSTDHLTVTLSGEVLLLQGILYGNPYKYPPKISKVEVYKVDPELDTENDRRPPIEVRSLGNDEALLIDLGITTSVKDVPGIESNSIYFSRHELDRSQEYKVDICVYNLATKTLKGFPNLSDMPLKDARWFIPTLS